MSRQLSTYRVTYLNGPMGVVATGRRQINRGKEFDKFYPNRKPKEVTLGRGDSYFTLQNMVERLKTDYHEAQAISDHLFDPDLNKFCRNIFNHIYKNFQYKLDPHTHEQIKGVAGSYFMRLDGIDCDDMAFLAGCILYAQGITFAFRKIAPAATGDFSHVYVVVPKSANLALSKRNNYYVIDPVLDQYNYEYPSNDLPKYYDEVLVKSSKMNGLEGFGMNGIEDYQLDRKSGWEKLRDDILNGTEVAPDGYSTSEFVEKVSSLISFWDIPDLRDYTIAELMEDETGMNGMDGFFKKVFRKVKKTAKKVSGGIQKGVKVVGKAVGKGAAAVGKTVAKVATGAVKLTTAPMRLLAREGIKIWFKKLGRKKAKSLWPGLYSESQAKSVNIDSRDWRKRRDNWNKVKKIFTTLGGDPRRLAQAIHDGAEDLAKRKSWFIDFRKVWNSSLGGEEGMYYEDANDPAGMGEAVTATAATAAASTFIAAILKILDGTSDDPKIQAIQNLAKDTKSVFDKIQEKKDDVTKFISPDKSDVKIVSPGPPNNPKHGSGLIKRALSNQDEESFFDKNKKVIIIGGASVATLTAGYFGYRHWAKSKKKKSGMSGVRKRKTNTRKTSKTANKRKSSTKTITI